MSKGKIKIVIYMCALLLCILLFWTWYQTKEQEDYKIAMPDEYSLSMMVQESRYSLGLQRMIKKIFVEEKIRINVQVIPDEQASSIIRMKVNTGTVPDLLGFNLPAVYGLIKPELYLENLENEKWTAQLKQPMYKGEPIYDTYGMPFQENLGLGGIIYNKEVFAQYHIEVPTTEEEFEQVCEELAGYGITPVLMCSDRKIPQMWMDYTIPLAMGGNEACEKMVEAVVKGESTLEEYPQIATVIDDYLNLFEKEWVNEDYLSIEYQEALKRLVDGNGAMMMGNYGTVGDAKYVDNEVALGMYSVPFSYNVNHEMVTPYTSYGLVIFQESEKKDLAKKVLELWSTPDYLELWFMESGGDSSFQGVETKPIVLELRQQYVTYMKEHEILYEWNTHILPFYNVNIDKMWLYYMEAPERNSTGQELLQQFSQDVELYLER